VVWIHDLVADLEQSKPPRGIDSSSPTASRKAPAAVDLRRRTVTV
jgi:hypothetical protein